MLSSPYESRYGVRYGTIRYGNGVITIRYDAIRYDAIRRYGTVDDTIRGDRGVMLPIGDPRYDKTVTFYYKLRTG